MIASWFRLAVSAASRYTGLLALGGLVGALEVGTWLLVAPFLGQAEGVALLGLVLTQRLALLAVLTVLLGDVYVAAREELGARAALRRAVDRSGPPEQHLFPSLLVSRVVAVGLTLGIGLVLLVLLGIVDTTLVWTEAYVGVGTDRELLAFVGVAGSVLLASTLARGAVGLHDLRSLEGDGEPWRAPLWSLRSWRSRRRRLPWYALVRGVLLTLPLAVAVLVLRTAGTQPVGLSVAAVAFVGVTGVARAILANYQIEAYEATADDADATDVGTGVPRSRRVAVAAMVLVAAVAGMAVLRAADVHPAPDDAPADLAPENAEATVETAIERTAERDGFVEQRTDVWNGTAEQWQPRTTHQIRFDRSDRQLQYFGTHVAGANRTDRTIYSTDGRFAMLRVPSPPTRPAFYHVPFQRGSWTVLVGPPYGWALEERYGYPPADAGWELVEATDERIVYRLAGGDSLTGADLGPLLGVPDDEDVTLAGVSDVRLVVDRNSLTVRRLTGSVAYVDARSGDARRVEKRFERTVTDVGAVDVGEPSALPSPSLPAWLWDVVYY